MFSEKAVRKPFTKLVSCDILSKLSHFLMPGLDVSRLWKVKNYKPPLCSIQSHILLSNSSKLPKGHFLSSPRTLGEQEKAGFIMQRTHHCATARMCQACRQTALLNSPIKNVLCWARYDTLLQHQYLISFFDNMAKIHYILPLDIRHKKDQ